MREREKGRSGLRISHIYQGENLHKKTIYLVYRGSAAVRRNVVIQPAFHGIWRSAEESFFNTLGEKWPTRPE